jgi:hypothetical protein
MGCLLVAASPAGMGQSIFISPPPAISAPALGPVKTTADSNQATMSQIINQLNQRQLQLSVAGAQTSAQRTVFVPQRITVKSAK